METITVTVPPDPPEAEHPMEPFHYEQFEQERLRVVKRLHEITAFLKSTHPPQLKQEILNEINAKSLMDVVCPSTAIPVPKASMLPRKSDPNKAKKKKKATAFL